MIIETFLPLPSVISLVLGMSLYLACPGAKVAGSVAGAGVDVSDVPSASLTYVWSCENSKNSVS